MNKKCARSECGKTVYPIEELRCLDKVWHKQCFKCTVCGMTLTMKNYKGYDKMPYCEPHYPKTVASVVVDTPEMRRLAENTRLQSQVKYHEEFEKSKGQKLEVTDDPEVARHLRNTKVQSQVAYHGESVKKKLQDESRPQLQEGAANGQSYGHESSSSYTPAQMDRYQQQPNYQTSQLPNRSNNLFSTIIYSSEQGGRVPVQQRQVGSIADYDPLNGNWGSVGSSKTAEKINKLSGRESASNQRNEREAKANATNQTVTQVGTADTSKPAASKGFTVEAIYGYTAAEKDEVTFIEGDFIVNCESVDEGWMTGTVARTKQWGMLPSNYVKKVKQVSGQHYLV